MKVSIVRAIVIALNIKKEQSVLGPVCGYLLNCLEQPVCLVYLHNFHYICPTMINLKNITIRRGPNVLMENVNWTIFVRQRIGMIGSNGSGKSTLFSMFARPISTGRRCS